MFPENYGLMLNETQMGYISTHDNDETRVFAYCHDIFYVFFFSRNVRTFNAEHPGIMSVEHMRQTEADNL